MKNINNKDRNNAFVQGYSCAVSSLIQKEGCVSTQAREMFRECLGAYDLNKFRRWGIDDHDIEIFKKHRKELK